MPTTPWPLTAATGRCGPSSSPSSVCTSCNRVNGIQETLYHDPYYQRHVVGAPVVRQVENNRIHSEANYAVFRTKYDKESTVFNVGRYIDTVVPTLQGFKFAERICVYDSEMIPNSIIYPI